MEIFHAVVISASTATEPSMQPRYQVSSRGAPPSTSTHSPVKTDPRMNARTASRDPRAPTYRSAQRPCRTPRVMNTVGSTAAKKAATAPQPRPAAPPYRQPTAMTVTMIQFFGSSR
ncbi:MAG TPA: hypothetical protein VI365_16545 [Trebonia sp.]